MWMTISIISVTLNVIFLLYTRWLLKGVTIMNEDIGNIQLLIKDFSSHLNSVNELEMFYGDETLASLIEHSRKLTEALDGLDLLVEDPVVESAVDDEDK